MAESKARDYILNGKQIITEKPDFSQADETVSKGKLYKIAKSGSYADLNNKPTPITSMSQLSNDFLMPSTENTEEGALSQSTSMPNKFFYWTQEE